MSALSTALNLGVPFSPTGLFLLYCNTRMRWLSVSGIKLRLARVCYTLRIMEVYVLTLTLAALVSSVVNVVHEDIAFSGCSNKLKEHMYGSDGEELYYSDFNMEEGVVTLPEFADPINWNGFYEIGLAEIEICKSNLLVAIEAYQSPAEIMDPPQTSIYPQDDIEIGVENTLICHVTGFFPPPVRVSWSKNNVNVTEDVSLSQYYPNNDGTYNIFSTLKFVPVDGDMYSCTVNHKTLTIPQTKIWDFEIPKPSAGPAAFCGVGLTLGLLGVATGTALLIKGSNCK